MLLVCQKKKSKKEENYAKHEISVVSNNIAHRWTTDVPMILSEVNPHHSELIVKRRERLGTERGFIAVKPNCSIQSYNPVLTAWREFEPYGVVVSLSEKIDSTTYSV